MESEKFGVRHLTHFSQNVAFKDKATKPEERVGGCGNEKRFLEAQILELLAPIGGGRSQEV